MEDPFGKIIFWHSDILPSRPTLFFLHGLTADHTMFEPQISAFRGDFNVIARDAPAHGKSRPYAKFTYENAAEGIKKILEKCGVSSVVLIGQSMGGFMRRPLFAGIPRR